jgi:hypothetical protein
VLDLSKLQGTDGHDASPTSAVHAVRLGDGNRIVGATLRQVQSLRQEISMEVPARSPTQQTVGHSGMQSREAMQEGYILDEAPILVSRQRLNPGARARVAGGRRVRSASPPPQREATSPQGVAQANMDCSAGADGRGGRRGPYDRPSRVADRGMREFSVTIGETGRDVLDGLEERLELFLADYCTRGLFGRERGAAEGNLHSEGIVETLEPITQLGLYTVLKRVVWGPDDAPQYAHMKVTGMTGRSELRTFVGMLGFALKIPTRAISGRYAKCVTRKGHVCPVRFCRYVTRIGGGIYLILSPKSCNSLV